MTTSESLVLYVFCPSPLVKLGGHLFIYGIRQDNLNLTSKGECLTVPLARYKFFYQLERLLGYSLPHPPCSPHHLLACILAPLLVAVDLRCNLQWPRGQREVSDGMNVWYPDGRDTGAPGAAASGRVLLER